MSLDFKDYVLVPKRDWLNQKDEYFKPESFVVKIIPETRIRLELAVQAFVFRLMVLELDHARVWRLFGEIGFKPFTLVVLPDEQAND